MFVANRVQQIRERTEPSQWGYVSSCDNPADLASRGATAEKLQSETAWLNGPRFLWNTELPSSQETVPLPENICRMTQEVKRVQVFSIKTDQVLRSSTCILERIEYFSDWQRAKRAIAICLKFKALLGIML